MTKSFIQAFSLEFRSIWTRHLDWHLANILIQTGNLWNNYVIIIIQNCLFYLSPTRIFLHIFTCPLHYTFSPPHCLKTSPIKTSSRPWKSFLSQKSASTLRITCTQQRKKDQRMLYTPFGVDPQAHGLHANSPVTKTFDGFKVKNKQQTRFN